MTEDEILTAIAAYYSARVNEHGESARGADWATEASQRLRFEKLLEFRPPERISEVLDYGCGYGALLDYLDPEGSGLRYTGFDVSAEMVQRACRRYQGRDRVAFTQEASSLVPHDFVVASGIFNVKLGCQDAEWQRYVAATLDRLNALSLRGFSFNALSTYSDAEKRRPDLFYADPRDWFDRCKSCYSPRVALLHDYRLWEFTILVRKDPT